MVFSRKQILLLCSTGLLLFLAAVLLVPATRVDAQCGSQASSCKNCHEVQGQDPVNADGTGWHESHAFGDFCYICHAGNSQSMVLEEAHAGMVPPLSDIQAACATCHPSDMGELAQIYAATLGVTVGEGGAPAPPAGSQPGDGSDPGGQVPVEQPAETGQGSGEMLVAGQDVIDYQQRYDEASGVARPVNVGNVIAVTLIFAILVGGGAFVVYNERKRGELPIFRKKETATVVTATELPEIEGVPAEVAALIPHIARLNPLGLHALQRLLENPEAASELFHSLSKLDPELVRRVRNLDRTSRELLLAMSGD